MCGRFSLTKEELEIEKRFQARFYSNDLIRRYNVAPGQVAWVITADQPDQIRLFKWGLVPSWAKEKSIGNKMINAKSETVFEKPSFRNLIKSKRCLVLADGFYEWKKGEGKSKIPYRIGLHDFRLFAFAGLYDHWKDPESGEPLDTFTIITTAANQLVSPVHDRMPVILRPEDEGVWLNKKTDKETIAGVLDSYNATDMEMYSVSTLVNSPSNNIPEIITPVTYS